MEDVNLILHQLGSHDPQARHIACTIMSQLLADDERGPHDEASTVTGGDGERQHALSTFQLTLVAKGCVAPLVNILAQHGVATKKGVEEVLAVRSFVMMMLWVHAHGFVMRWHVHQPPMAPSL